MTQRDYGLTRRCILAGGMVGACVSRHAFSQNANSVSQPQLRPTFTGNCSVDSDQAWLQEKLDRKGTIKLDRDYNISSPLTIHGDTKLVGTGRARIIWHGSGQQPMLRDSSVVDPSQSNRNIVLQGFELIGDGGGSAGAAQNAIEFYRTGNVVIRDLVVHDVDGSGIRWGNSYQDTTDVLVERCHIYACRTGDAIQGSGRGIVIRNNVIGITNGQTKSFGDSGIALIMDFSRYTNRHGAHSSDITIEHNDIIGNHNSDGGYVDSNGASQTGIAAGPFATGHFTDLRISNNLISGCYVNIWLTVMREVKIVGNLLLPHASPLTANVRLDGVSGVLIESNVIRLAQAPRGMDYSCLMLNAQRNVYGASHFDADVTRFTIIGNTLSAGRDSVGIRLTFGQIYDSPPYIARLNDGVIDQNRFVGILQPVSFAPRSGEIPNVCNNVSIRRNIIDGAAASVVSKAGNPNQYVNVMIANNHSPAHVHVQLGTGS